MSALKKYLPVLILCAAILLFVAGIAMQEPRMMMGYAIVVCLSCIGIV